MQNNLRTTPPCDDKEKLRRKLALLQREYSRTVQRLKRAERSEALRKHHVPGSRTTEQNLGDQCDTTGTPGSSCPNKAVSYSVLEEEVPCQTAPPRTPQGRGPTGGPVESQNSHTISAVNFPLLSDDTAAAAFPLTPDPGGVDPAARGGGGYRASPSLRLRSRSSRLRWEKRWREDNNNSQDRPDPGGKALAAGTPGDGEEDRTGRTGGEAEEAVDASIGPTQLYNTQGDSESESPSLLLTHWNTATGRGGGGEEREGRVTATELAEEEEEGNSRGRDRPSLPVTHWSPATHGGQDEDEGSPSGTGGRREGERNVRVREASGGKGKGVERSKVEKKTEEDEQSDGSAVPGRSCGEGEEVGGGGGEERQEQRGLLLPDFSSTLVEGLLFPVEYYVRTTRRMSSSRSHPDLHAVLHYMLSPPGRRQRARGRGGGRGRARRALHTDADERLTASLDDRSSSSPPLEPAAALLPAPASIRWSSSDASASQTSAGSSSSSGVQSSAGPGARGRGRGRRRGRGRGRGRPPAFGRSVSLDAATPLPQQPLPLPPSPSPIPASRSAASHPQPSSPTVAGAEERPLLVTQAAAAPVVPCLSQSPPVTLSPAGLEPVVEKPPRGVDEPDQQGPPAASGHVLEKVYPIFTKSRPANEQTPQLLNRVSWWSLLLPPQPSAPPPLSPLLPVGPGLRDLATFDLQQDFHLPDEQFASLKLHKLRQATETFCSPSYNTRNGGRWRYCADQQPTPLALLLSPTPPVAPDPRPDPPDGGRRSMQQRSAADLQSSPSFTPILDHRQPTTANPSDSDVVAAGDSSDSSAAELPGGIQSLLISAGEVKDCPPSGAVHTAGHSPFAKHQTPDRSPLNKSLSHCEEQPPQQGSCEDPSQGCTRPSTQTRKDSDPREEEAPEPEHLDSSRLPKDTSSSSSPCPAEDGSGDSPVLRGRPVDHAPSQLLLSPSLASPPWGTGPPLPSLGPTSPLLAPELPPERELGGDGQGRTRDLPPPPPLLLSSSPPSSAPSFSLLSPSSSTRARSSPLPPPPLSSPPGPTSDHLLPFTLLSPRRSPSSSSSSPSCCNPPVRQEKLSIGRPQGEVQVSSHLPAVTDQCQRMAVPTSSPPVPGSQPQASMGTAPVVVTSDLGTVGDGERSRGSSSEHRVMTCTHTLKTPAGGPLVDACCVWRPPGQEECVAVAGKWAVCVWEHTSTAGWSLLNTWTFCEPVISVFAVPDAVGLLCVALGQLEIREVRMLSCSGLSQTLLCEGVVHSVVGVANSRVVSSSPSATGSTLKLFDFSEDGSSTSSSQSLAPPGVCVGTLAAVDGLSDTLIGSAEGGHLFLWNLRSGQLLRQISLEETLSHTVCLNGYSDSGVLFVLLQHSMEASDSERGGVVCAEEEEEKKKTVLFSVVAVNPLSGKSLLATQLYQPEAWSGRLCEADVMGSGVVGLSQNGCVCVWELPGGRGGGGGLPLWAPEGEGWQLARWGRPDTLLAGHHNGDLTLYRYLYANPAATDHHAPPC